MKTKLTLKEIQTVLLDILQDVHDFCVENNIKYSLYGATMIGALRHKGFVPWDDDVDIIMPRPDYERFCKLYQHRKFRLMDASHTKDYYLAFARVVETEKTAFHTTYPWCGEEVGVWIDIFPADGFPDDASSQEALYRKCYECRNELRVLRKAKSNFHGSWKERIHQLKSKIFTFNGWNARNKTIELDKLTRTIRYGDTNHWASLTCLKNMRMDKHHPMSQFDQCTLMPYEDREFYVLNGYDEHLRQRYGDYMQLPPEDQRVGCHSSFMYFYWK